MIAKNFEGYLILNWKTKQMRVTKKKKADDNPYEIPVKIKIKVKMPEQKDIVAKGEITMGEKQAEVIIEDAI